MSSFHANVWNCFILLSTRLFPETSLGKDSITIKFRFSVWSFRCLAGQRVGETHRNEEGASGTSVALLGDGQSVRCSARMGFQGTPEAAGA